jgi:hypothetical protein
MREALPRFLVSKGGCGVGNNGRNVEIVECARHCRGFQFQKVAVALETMAEM